MVGSSELSIRTIVSSTISTKPYRKAMITIIIFSPDHFLSSSRSVSLRYLTTTMVAYFVIPTDLTERIVDSIRHTLFHIGSLQGVSFLDSFGKSTLVSDLASGSADITFFTFCSVVTVSDINQRFPSTAFLPEFSLKFPQNSVSSNPTPAPNFPSSILPAPTESPSVSDSSLNFVLENATYGVITEMDAT